MENRTDRRKWRLTKKMDKLKALQINIGRSRAAIDLATATAIQVGVGVVIMSEPNKRMADNMGFHLIS